MKGGGGGGGRVDTMIVRVLCDTEFEVKRSLRNFYLTGTILSGCFD